LPVQRVLIVGGGIAGLSLATALQRLGLELLVVERAPAWTPLGAGIVLSVNAMAVMRRLGLAEAARARGLALGEAAVTDAQGRRLSRTDLRRLAPRHGDTVAIHRGDLHEVLLAGCTGVPIRLDTTVVSLVEEGDGVVARLSDGAVARFDLVVGADGLRSRVRERVFGANPPVYAGYTCWRFVVEAPFPLERTVEMWGRGRRLGLVPLPGGRVYGFAVANAPRGSSDPGEVRIERFQARFGGFRGSAPAVLAGIRHPAQLIHNDLEEVIQRPWHRGAVLLVGDAAHATTPNMGQGAAMALEDSAVLAELLAEKRPLVETLARFQARREGRVRWVQNQSRRFGRLAQWENGAACALRNLLLRAIPDAAAARALERLADAPI
jgi:2-heptyl-3-hydroxy-4(1H)-quinolone synthase